MNRRGLADCRGRCQFRSIIEVKLRCYHLLLFSPWHGLRVFTNYPTTTFNLGFSISPTAFTPARSGESIKWA